VHISFAKPPRSALLASPRQRATILGALPGSWSQDPPPGQVGGGGGSQGARGGEGGQRCRRKDVVWGVLDFPPVVVFVTHCPGQNSTIFSTGPVDSEDCYIYCIYTLKTTLRPTVSSPASRTRPPITRRFLATPGPLGSVWL
jgi:hypothetical protein